MKKMKLAVMHGIGKELTRDELKNVFGGSGSGSGSGTPSSTPKIDACKGKKHGSSCDFYGTGQYSGTHFYGTCQWAPYQTNVLYCSDLN